MFFKIQDGFQDGRRDANNDSRLSRNTSCLRFYQAVECKSQYRKIGHLSRS